MEPAALGQTTMRQAYHNAPRLSPQQLTTPKYTAEDGRSDPERDGPAACARIYLDRRGWEDAGNELSGGGRR